MNSIVKAKYELIDMICESYKNIVSLSDDAQIKVFDAMSNDKHFTKETGLKLVFNKKIKDDRFRAITLGYCMGFNHNDGLFFEVEKNVKEGCKIINDIVTKCKVDKQKNISSRK